jgi:ribosomal protein S18 acetylase RimI-like enzyme
MIRNICEKDYDYLIRQLNAWWGGRHMVDMLPRLFFIHFQQSSFVFEENRNVVGFLIGFISPSIQQTAYIHFIGVDPEYRKQKIASRLYEMFIDYCKRKDISIIQCVTSPRNKKSIAFHHKLGFKAAEYNEKGLPIAIPNYDGLYEHRVVLSLNLSQVFKL